jgi:hypothetical protein
MQGKARQGTWAKARHIARQDKGHRQCNARHIGKARHIVKASHIGKETYIGKTRHIGKAMQGT